MYYLERTRDDVLDAAEKLLWIQFMVVGDSDAGSHCNADDHVRILSAFGC